MSLPDYNPPYLDTAEHAATNHEGIPGVGGGGGVTLPEGAGVAQTSSSRTIPSGSNGTVIVYDISLFQVPIAELNVDEDRIVILETGMYHIYVQTVWDPQDNDSGLRGVILDGTIAGTNYASGPLLVGTYGYMNANGLSSTDPTFIITLDTLALLTENDLLRLRLLNSDPTNDATATQVTLILKKLY